MLTSCLTAVKNVVKYCEKVYERLGTNLFWSIINSGEILDKLKDRDSNANSLSTYDFSTLFTSLPHNLIKGKLIDLIIEKALLTLHVTTETHFYFGKPLKISCMVLAKCIRCADHFMGQQFYSIWHQVV